MSTTYVRRAIMPVFFAFALVSTLLAGTPAGAYDSDHTVMKGSPAQMGQTNGPVWAVQIAGGKIFVGGGFTSTRPGGAARGTSETGQGYLAAFDAETGAPVPGFNPVLRNTYNSAPPIVRSMAVSPDGATLYVGGDFNQINGERTEHVAAFNTTTGAFKGVVGYNGTDGFVQALAVSNDGKTLYAGGAFTRANWSKRANLAAFNLTDGSLRDWAPQISAPVTDESLRVVALAVSADDSKVFLAGPFRSVNGSAAQGFMATSATTGGNVTGFRASYLYAPTSWGTSLAVKDNTVYLGGRDDRTSALSRTEGVFAIDTATGNQRWYARCFGDTFAVLPVGDDVYVGSHAHDCSSNGGMPETTPRTNLSIHALDRDTGTVRPYFVQSGGTSANPDSLLLSRALASDGNQLVMGGGFDTVNSGTQTNVTRFLKGSSAPDRAAWPSGRSCNGCAYTNLTVLKAADRDDIDLTYEIYRDWSTTNPIATVRAESFPYTLSTFAFRDTGVVRGQRVYYRVLVRDPSGNAVWSVRTPTMTVGQSEGSASASTASTSSRAATSDEAIAPKTAAQRAAQREARFFGLRNDGTRGSKVKRPKLPKPVMDDKSVPTRPGRRK